jgi:hypothetical protein
MQVNGDRKPSETIAYHFAIQSRTCWEEVEGMFLDIKV